VQDNASENYSQIFCRDRSTPQNVNGQNPCTNDPIAHHNNLLKTKPTKECSLGVNKHKRILFHSKEWMSKQWEKIDTSPHKKQSHAPFLPFFSVQNKTKTNYYASLSFSLVRSPWKFVNSKSKFLSWTDEERNEDKLSSQHIWILYIFFSSTTAPPPPTFLNKKDFRCSCYFMTSWVIVC